MSITIMMSKVIRPLFAVAVLAGLLGIAGGSSVRPVLVQEDGPPVVGPCPCSDARCLPLCHDSVGAADAVTPGALVASGDVALDTPPESCPCIYKVCAPMCQGSP
jgi:hypothetical protein